MPSPFTFFRRHAAVLMVVMIGLSMMAFIFLDTLMKLDPTQLSELGLLLLPLLGATTAWTITARSEHSTGYACCGAVAGIVLAVSLQATWQEYTVEILTIGSGCIVVAFWAVGLKRSPTRSWARSFFESTTEIRIFRFVRVFALPSWFLTALVGIAIGYVVAFPIRRLDRSYAVDTTVFKLTSAQVETLIKQRQLVNAFLESAQRRAQQQWPEHVRDQGLVDQQNFRKVDENGDGLLDIEEFQKLNLPGNTSLRLLDFDRNGRLSPRELEQFVQFRAFQFPGFLEDARFTLSGRPLEQDVVLGELLRSTADRLGVVVDAAMIKRFKQRATTTPGSNTRPLLSNQAYQELLDSLDLAEADLDAALVSELKARLTLRLLVPPTPATPHQYWSTFRQLNERRAIEAVAIPAEAFFDGVEDPDQRTLLPYFNDHRASLSGQQAPGAPGFFQPRRVKLAYFVARYDDFVKLVEDNDPVTDELDPPVDPVTDEDVEVYYRENKDARFSNPAHREIPQPVESDADKPDSDKTETDKPKTDKSKTDKPKTDKPKTGKGDKPKENSPPADQSRKSEPAENAPPPLVLDDEPPPPPEPRSIPARYFSLDSERRAEIREELTRERTLRLIRHQLQRAIDGTSPPRGMGALGDLRRIPDPVDPDPISAADIRSELRQLAETLTQVDYQETPLLSAEELEELEIGRPGDPGFSQVPGQLSGTSSVLRAIFGNETARLYSPTLDPAKDRTFSRFDNPAGESFHAYWVTEDVPAHIPEFEPLTIDGSRTLDEINDQTFDYEAFPTDPTLRPGTMTFAAYFQAVRRQSQSDSEGLRVRHLVVIEKPAAESGATQFEATERVGEQTVNELVTESWKLRHAGSHHLIPSDTKPPWKTAEARCRQLQKLPAVSDDKPLAEALANQTVTGTEKDTRMVTVIPAEFSWLTQPRSMLPPSMGGRQQPITLSEVPLLAIDDRPGPGEEFMKMVFNELDEIGSFGVAPNADHSVWYLVRLAERPDANTVRRSYDRFQGENPVEATDRYTPLTNRQRQWRFEWLEEFVGEHGWNWQIRTR